MNKTIIGVIILILLAGGIWYGVKAKKPATQETKIEEFTGNLKEAMAKNLPMKCEWSQDKNSGASYVKGKNIYMETIVEGKKGYMITRDNCTWTWGDQMPQGIKFCAEPPKEESQNIAEQPASPSLGGPEVGTFKTEGVDWKMEYKCSPSMFGDEKFELPGEVKFNDIAEMMKGFQQAIPSLPAVPGEEE